VLAGDEIRLGSQPVAALGMVFHELATNAAKYGALSGTGGRVEVAWHSDEAGPDGRRPLCLTWTEYGGPEINTSETRGFGIAFISRCVEYELAGKADVNFPPDGVRCSVEFPLSGNAKNQPAGGRPSQ
jgi:two-component sensor histidine kinase